MVRTVVRSLSTITEKDTSRICYSRGATKKAQQYFVGPTGSLLHLASGEVSSLVGHWNIQGYLIRKNYL